MSADRGPGRPLRVVVIGSESTGKTTLAVRLAAELGVEWLSEASRAYAERVGRELTAADVEPIGREHCAADDAARRAAVRAARPLVVLDADLWSTVVYADHYYGACPPWIEPEARRRQGELYLLHHPDVPWVRDGVRDRPSPAERAAVHARFAAVLAGAGATVCDIRGGWEERYAAARRAALALLGRGA